MRLNRVRYRGVTAVLAMLYLVLFSTLAAGFVAAVSTSMQVSNNEVRVARALLAAESGMQFARYQLSNIDVPHSTAAEDLFEEVYNDLSANLNGTGNLDGMSVGLEEDVISIPADEDDYITLEEGGGQFRITIEQLADKLRVKVVGRDSNQSAQRAIQMNYGIAENASAIFDYGVASKGKVSTSGSARIKGLTDPTKGSVLSTCMSDSTPVEISGKEVSGDISITNPSGNVTYAGASVGGTTNAADIAANHVHKGVPEPEFPTIDTAAFEPYVTSTYVSGMTTFDNCRIPANADPTFTGNVTIKGVLYIETPNNIEFRGNVDIQGCIVVQNDPTGTLSDNILDFSGSVSAAGVETLPSSYGDLRNLTGSFILAPKFHVKASGNFGTVAGSIIASKVSMTGSAEGTVQGSIITLEDTPTTLAGSSEIIIASTGTTNYPSGVFFGHHYYPLADTYEEVEP